MILSNIFLLVNIMLVLQSFSSENCLNVGLNETITVCASHCPFSVILVMYQTRESVCH